jgi:hypothetical protein
MSPQHLTYQKKKTQQRPRRKKRELKDQKGETRRRFLRVIKRKILTTKTNTLL